MVGATFHTNQQINVSNDVAFFVEQWQSSIESWVGVGLITFRDTWTLCIILWHHVAADQGTLELNCGGA